VDKLYHNQYLCRKLNLLIKVSVVSILSLHYTQLMSINPKMKILFYCGRLYFAVFGAHEITILVSNYHIMIGAGI
jgi:hypothetical protein